MQKNCLNYPVEIVEDVFGESESFAKLLNQVTGVEKPRIILVADMNVVQRVEGLGAKIGKYVQAHGIELAASPVVIAGGEKIKADGLNSVMRLASALIDAKLGVHDAVVAIGGGTLLDVTGYAAAQVRGGLRCLRMPTTPAAMIDAAFAERAAIDAPNVKDALSVSALPAAVLIDPSLAATVLDGVWRGGIGAAVRIAAVQDPSFMKSLTKLAPGYAKRELGALSEIVKSALAVRCKKGGTDFAEWSAQRLESMSDYKLPHGYAIAIGIAIDLAYAVAKGHLKDKDAQLIRGVLETCGALDGVVHSQHLLNQTESVLAGLKAKALAKGCEAVTLPTAPGKSMVETEPDWETYRKILKELSTPKTV